MIVGGFLSNVLQFLAGADRQKHSKHSFFIQYLREIERHLKEKQSEISFITSMSDLINNINVIILNSYLKQFLFNLLMSKQLFPANTTSIILPCAIYQLLLSLVLIFVLLFENSHW